MTLLSDILKDGFSLEKRNRIKNLSFLSVNIALRSYFGTYKPMQYLLHLFDPTKDNDQETIDFNHMTGYNELCFETISDRGDYQRKGYTDGKAWLCIDC